MQNVPINPARIALLNRREFVCSATSGVAIVAAATCIPAATSADDKGRSPAFELAYRRILGESEPLVDDRVTLELPDIPENGNTVPFRIEVVSPMTADDSIKTLYLMSTGNPQPMVAAFHFTTQSGRAAVAGRMRLARSQDVVALAERSDGTFLVSVRQVEVTIGGCGN